MLTSKNQFFGTYFHQFSTVNLTNRDYYLYGPIDACRVQKIIQSKQTLGRAELDKTTQLFIKMVI